jgi:hypothetical protein
MQQEPHQGAPAVHGGERAEPTENTRDAQRVGRPVDVVGLFAPWAGPEERAFRLRIHKAQTIAAKRATFERNSRARVLYYEAASLALGWAYRRVENISDLERILWALCQLFMAASHIARVEGPDA